MTDDRPWRTAVRLAHNHHERHITCGPTGADSYVLGDINVSFVFPIPDEAPNDIARQIADRLRDAL